MKRFKKLMAVSLVVALIASLIQVIAFATTPTIDEIPVKITYFGESKPADWESTMYAKAGVYYASLSDGDKDWASTSTETVAEIMRANADASSYITYYNADGFKDFYFRGMVNDGINFSSGQTLNQYFKFYTSKDGVTYTEYTAAAPEGDGQGNEYSYRKGKYNQFRSYKVNIPVSFDTKYVKIEAMKDWWYGIYEEVGYTAYSVPDAVKTKITVTNGTTPVNTGDTVFNSSVKVETACEGEYTVEATRNGAKYNIPDNGVIEFAGDYVIRAYNDYSDNSIAFKIKKGGEVIYGSKTKVDSANSCYKEYNMHYDSSIKDNSWFGMGYAYHVISGSTGAYVIYKSATEFTNFWFCSALNNKNLTNANIAEYFLVYGSSDDETYTPLTISVDADSDYYKTYGTAPFKERRISVTVPEGTKYVKIMPQKTGWDTTLISRVTYYDKDLSAIPTVTVKDAKGEIVDDTFCFESEAIYSVYCSEEYDTLIIKDGNYENPYPVPKDGKLTEKGEYIITASNEFGSDTFTFELTVGYENDIVYASRNKIDANEVCFEQYLMHYDGSIDISTSNPWYGMGYAYHASTDAVEPYVIYSADGGFSSFSFYSALNMTALTNTNLSTYFKVYGSVNGNPNSYIELDASVDPDFAESAGNTGSFRIRKVNVSVSKAVKYVKIMPLKTKYWYDSLISRVTYSAKDAKNIPIIRASSGEGTVYNGDEAFSDVTLKLGCAEGVKYTVSAIKDNKKYTVPSNYVFTEEGEYEITAESDYGKNVFTFKITSGIIKTYDFTKNYDLAVKNWGYLNQGDSATLMVNQLGENIDYNWWGLTEARTYLTLGSDKTGWNTNGWFITDLKDESGKKYTGMVITYNTAYQNAAKLNQKLQVYASYDGGKTYNLVKPVTSENLKLGNIAVQRNIDTYDFGSSDALIKILMQTDKDSAWEAGKLGITKLQLLALPAIDITAQGKNVADNGVSTKDVDYDIKNAVTAEVYLDGNPLSTDLSGKLTVDGLYTIKAWGKIGYIEKSFVLAKQTPIAVAWDADGEFIADGATLVDDIRFEIYNGNATATKDSNDYTLPSDKIILKNGVYAITVTNDATSNTLNFTLNRPKPTINTKDFWSAAATEGSTVRSDLEVSFVVTDSYEILKDGKPYKLVNGLLTENGVYKITATNHAGDTVLNFTLEHFPELPAINHTGDVVEKYNYDVGGNTTEGVYRFKDVKRDTSLKGNKWVGVTNAIYNLVDSKSVTEGEMVFQAPLFKSFGVHVVIAPTVTKDITQSYMLLASADSLNYEPIEFTYEHNQAYLTAPYGNAYTAYRIVPNSIPEGTKYIKLILSKQASVNAWDVGVFAVEYSYNKSDIGKFDQKEIAGLIASSEEGASSKIKIINDKGNVLSKDTMSKLENTDKGLEIDILNSKLEDIYKLSFIGSDLYEVRPYNLYFDDTITSDTKLLEDEIVSKSFKFSDAGNLPITTNMSIYMGDQIGHRNVYAFVEGEWMLISSGYIEDGWLSFATEYGGDYVVTKTVEPQEEEITDGELGDDTVLDDNAGDEVIGEVIDGTGIIDEPTLETAKQRLMKITKITRLKTVWLVVFIVSGVLLLAGLVVGTIFLIKFYKKRKAKQI